MVLGGDKEESVQERLVWMDGREGQLKAACASAELADLPMSSIVFDSDEMCMRVVPAYGGLLLADLHCTQNIANRLCEFLPDSGGYISNTPDCFSKILETKYGWPLTHTNCPVMFRCIRVCSVQM